MSSEDPLITIGDIRASGHCVRGAKAWFAAHDLDFADFVRNGAPASVLLATGDDLAQFVVSRTLERRDG